jgi:hypothetical protein
MLPFVADMPPQMQERVICSISAAVEYKIPANIMLAVAEKEGGQPGQWALNNNGTYDIGPMQFNTRYLTDLAEYGISRDHVAVPGCYPYQLAAWRLHNHIAYDTGDLWTKAANYHSRTPRYNSAYRVDLMKKADQWANWLDKHVSTSLIVQRIMDVASKFNHRYMNKAERQEGQGSDQRPQNKNPQKGG